jgi:hypothetical protein
MALWKSTKHTSAAAPREEQGRQHAAPMTGEERIEKIFSQKPGLPKSQSPFYGKTPVLSLVQRGGKVRSMRMDRVTQENLKPVLEEYLAEGVHVMTDSSCVVKLSDPTQKHDRVNHKEKDCPS